MQCRLGLHKEPDPVRYVSGNERGREREGGDREGERGERGQGERWREGERAEREKEGERRERRREERERRREQREQREKEGERSERCREGVRGERREKQMHRNKFSLLKKISFPFTPVCNTGEGICVECMDNSNCAGNAEKKGKFEMCHLYI